MLTNLRVALKQFEKDHQPKKSKPNIVKVISKTHESEGQDIEELEGSQLYRIHCPIHQVSYLCFYLSLVHD
jgi:hypothetical protein